MKKFLQSSLLIVLLLGVSSPAKASNFAVLIAGFWGVQTVLLNILASIKSDSARDAVEEKVAASDQKDTIKKELKAGTVTYGISAAAGLFTFAGFATAWLFEAKRLSHDHTVIAAFASLALVASAVGMGVNGAAYHAANALFSDRRLNVMLGTSIAGISLNVVSAALLACFLPRNTEAPAGADV